MAESQRCRHSMFEPWIWVGVAWPCASLGYRVGFGTRAMPSNSLPWHIAKIEWDDLPNAPIVVIPCDRKLNRPFRGCKWRPPHDSRHRDNQCCPFRGVHSRADPSHCRSIRCHWSTPSPIYCHWIYPFAMRGWHSRAQAIYIRRLLQAKTIHPHKSHPNDPFLVLGWILPVAEWNQINFGTNSMIQSQRHNKIVFICSLMMKLIDTHASKMTNESNKLIEHKITQTHLHLAFVLVSAASQSDFHVILLTEFMLSPSRFSR